MFKDKYGIEYDENPIHTAMMNWIKDISKNYEHEKKELEKELKEKYKKEEN